MKQPFGCFEIGKEQQFFLTTQKNSFENYRVNVA